MHRIALVSLLLTFSLTACVSAPQMSRQTGYVDVNGVHTYYEKYGSGPPLVLVHGAAMVIEAWAPQIEAFSKEYTVYVPERRGVGRTADVEGPWTYAGMAEDTAAFFDAMGIKNAAVVGLSDGAIIALILGYTRPDLVGQLAASGANINPEGLGPLKDVFEAMSPEQILETAPPEVQRFLEIHRQVSPDQGRDLPKSLAKMKEMWLNFDVPRAELARITAPTLILAGDHDMIPVPHTVEIWSAIPNAKLCIAPDSTHFWLEERPELANGIILTFLSETRTAQPSDAPEGQ